MDHINMNADEYVKQLIYDNRFLNSEYRKYVENFYTVENLTGTISSEILHSIICKARWNRKVRQMLGDLLWYIDGKNLGNECFRMLLGFSKRHRNNYIGTLVHLQLPFYQMEILNQYPNSFEAFAWLFDKICASDSFQKEDILHLLEENAFVTKHEMLLCIEENQKKYGSLEKIDAAIEWVNTKKC